MYVLRRPASPQGPTLAKLGTPMAITSPAGTKRVEGLNARRLTERLPDPSDRRAARSRLTAVGRTLTAAGSYSFPTYWIRQTLPAPSSLRSMAPSAATTGSTGRPLAVPPFRKPVRKSATCPVLGSMVMTL
jgi:hypothetical protein